eukprot:TRINITY_DN1704_c0_g1_i1.p1 TRINITY_DN1704_c0_g1~~TRINITY_DN1704_c0_g1_i1.p1  ORF type:complete len:358 (-),score=87.35 TRINITY_DN1704_c0_g1_i1:237-1235(-)
MCIRDRYNGDNFLRTKRQSKLINRTFRHFVKMATYGVALNVAVNNAILTIRNTLRVKGGLTRSNLQSTFNSADTLKDGKLDVTEFQRCCIKLGIILATIDQQALLKYFDSDRNGTISAEEFITALIVPLTTARLQVVNNAWFKLDPRQTGSVSVSVCRSNFSAAKHMDVIRGIRTEEEVFQQDFLAYFPTVSTTGITYMAFIAYYTDESSKYLSDDVFCPLVQDTWNLTSATSLTVTADELKTVVRDLRFRIINITSGSQDETLLKSVFAKFDSNKSGFLTLDELNAMLIRLEMAIAPKLLGALFNFIDKNKSGYVEFVEFANYIVNDPYPQ